MSDHAKTPQKLLSQIFGTPYFGEDESVDGFGKNLQAGQVYMLNSKKPYHPDCDIPSVWEVKKGVFLGFGYCWTAGQYFRIVFNGKTFQPNFYQYLKTDLETSQTGWTKKKDIKDLDKTLIKMWSKLIKEGAAK